MLLAVPAHCLAAAPSGAGSWFASELAGAGSWFVDLGRYHIGAHGQTSCHDCHLDVVHRPIHPDPSLVNRNLRGSFKFETCFECHEGTKSDLEKGLHAGRPLRTAESYTRCIACHDPHYDRTTKKGYSLGLPAPRRYSICELCHEERPDPPEPNAADAKCLKCHKAPGPGEKERVQRISQFCLGCHGQAATITAPSVIIPRIDTSKHITKGHNGQDCVSCHSHAARFEHRHQGSPDCLRCHTRHQESVIHDAHSAVTCQACHLDKIKVVRDPSTRKVAWQRSERTSQPSWLNMARPSQGTDSCNRCHYSGNQVGAAAMILPAKSLICMPCHAATFSANDLTSLLALAGFVLGILAVASVWFTGTVGSQAGSVARIHRSVKAGFGSRVTALPTVLFFDGLLQRKLFIQSRLRWFIHALIFWPFVVRFSWGFVALVGSLAWPTHDWVWHMLGKNWPLTAFVFDLTGLMVIFGIILAVLRRRISSDKAVIEGLPGRDWLALGLMGAVIIVGFLLEGARMAMSPSAQGGHWAFVGWALSFLWQGTSGLTEIYGYIWYLHAVLTGAFLLYLPFSGLFHLVMAPLVAALNAADHVNGRQSNTRDRKRDSSAHV